MQLAAEVCKLKTYVFTFITFSKRKGGWRNKLLQFKVAVDNQSMSESPLLLDMDPGIDDALALEYLLALDVWQLKAITVVGGNVSLPKTLFNARRLASLLEIELDVPIYGGCPKPLTRRLESAEYVHGRDGMGGAVLPTPGVSERSEHASNVLNELSHRYNGELTVIALGPLTNIAAAMIQDPSLAHRIKHLVFMGGAVNVPGNVPPNAAEFNIHVDPEAARIVVESGVQFTMVGLDVTNHAMLTREQIEGLDESSSRRRFTREILEYYLGVYRRSRGWDACALHDPLAVAVATDPGWVELKSGNLYVETQGEFTRGKTSFVGRELWARREIEGLSPEVGAGRVALAPAQEGFSAHFVEKLNGYATTLK